LIHVLYLVVRSWSHQLVPLTSPSEFLTSLAAATAMVYLFLEERTGTRHTGLFILIPAFVFQLLSSIFIEHTTLIDPYFQDRLFAFHTGMAILGYAGMVIAAIYGLMYLMLYYDLKASRFGLIYRRLPPLEILGQVNFYAAVVGFVFLTIAMVLGLIWAPSVFGAGWYLPPAIIGVLVTWFIYGACVATRTLIGWGGKHTAYFTLIGFVVANLIFSSLHDLG